MIAATNQTLVTPEELLAMPDGDRYELVDGQLVEQNMGFQSSRIATEISTILNVYCKANQLGWVAGADCGFQCFPDDPDRVRKPDVSFVHRSHMSATEEPEGFARIVPDLAVEVISKNDLFAEVMEKVDEYLGVGVRLVWVVDPRTQRIHVLRRDGGTILTNRDELSGEDVVPGFRCKIADIFAPPPGV